MNDFSKGSADDDAAAIERASVRSADMKQFLEEVRVAMDEERIFPIDPPQPCLSCEIIGETADIYVIWKWKGPNDFTYKLVPKSDLPGLIADAQFPQLSKEEREERAIVEEKLANANVEEKRRTVLGCAQVELHQAFRHVTCTKLLDDMEIVGASIEYVVAWKETDGHMEMRAKRLEDLGEEYMLENVRIPFPIPKFLKKIKGALEKLFGRK